MKYTLRDYQQESSNTSVWYLRKYGKPFIVVAATGAGKSLIIADVCHQLDEPVLILQPNKEILQQNYEKLRSYGVTDVAMYSASVKSKEIAKYTYATIQSIYTKPELFAHFKYVIIDECHLVNPKNLSGMYTTFLQAIGCTNVMGLTATPYRLDPGYDTVGGELYYTAQLKMINRLHPYFFKKIVYQIETYDLIKAGYLCHIDYFSDVVDTSDLQMNKSKTDFTDESVEKFWNEKRLRRIAQAAQYSHERNERCLIFCSSLRQANNALALIQALGLPANLVSGTTGLHDREIAIQRFKNGQTKIMLNVGVFTTGFDMPNLDCIVLARPTMSLALYYQMIGRGVRLDPDKPAKRLQVYDLVGIVKRLGRVETIKVIKEDDGFRDMVVSEAGVMTNKAVFRWFVKNIPKHKRG